MKTVRTIRTLFLAAALGIVPAALPIASQAQAVISVNIGPPALPVYAQPMCPGDGYIWVPGYWAWGQDGYYWVPGTWVMAPQPGLLWTPGYWGWGGAAYLWHPGYWGRTVGFYGGINYGFGYTGYGYEGGYWRNNHFYYNRTVNRINVVNIRNVYTKQVAVRNTTRVSFNGGRGGINARPTATQMQAQRDHRFNATPAQEQHRATASNNRELRQSVNRGRPPIAATPRPNEYNRGVEAARPQQQQRPMTRPEARPQQQQRPQNRPEPRGGNQPHGDNKHDR